MRRRRRRRDLEEDGWEGLLERGRDDRARRRLGLMLPLSQPWEPTPAAVAGGGRGRRLMARGVSAPPASVHLLSYLPISSPPSLQFVQYPPWRFQRGGPLLYRIEVWMMASNADLHAASAVTEDPPPTKKAATVAWKRPGNGSVLVVVALGSPIMDANTWPALPGLASPPPLTPPKASPMAAPPPTTDVVIPSVTLGNSGTPDANPDHDNLLSHWFYFFSDDNLCKDIFLRQHMDDQGWVPLSLIAGFNQTVFASYSDLAIHFMEHPGNITNSHTYQENVITSMENVMKFVIDESEDVQQDMPSCLLQDLASYLLKNVKKEEKGTPLDEYSKVVTSLFQDAIYSGVANNSDAPRKDTMADRKSFNKTISDESSQESSKLEQEAEA
ncbi:hypothetical protein ABZP36_028055 [Zizania latifolia]